MYGCGEQEVGVASGSGWNLWVWLLGAVLRRYIDFLILLIPTPLVSVLFCSSIPTFLFIKKNFFLFFIYYNCKQKRVPILFNGPNICYNIYIIYNKKIKNYIHFRLYVVP